MTSPEHRARSQARDEFEAWAPDYDGSLLNPFLFAPSHRCFLEELVGVDGQPAGQIQLLDIGCGTGNLAMMLAGSNLDVRVTGVDLADGMLQAARSKLDGSSGAAGVSFVAAEAEHLPFADASFNVITCSNSFHHYPNQFDAIVEMHRAMRPGGRLMVLDGFRDNVVGWFVFDVCISAVEKWSVRHCTWRQMREFMLDAGFQSVVQRKINWWFPLLLTVGHR